ncbi:unnamed protein product [Paramecium sonneborni]|uniref:Uncharacterized protein n=1 Tax=Paramecium sonneborni TaxID=65129 RepID=A0A8S1RWH8_9CILI|nr:unnamed protein product [Paramecium sonneborni]
MLQQFSQLPIIVIDVVIKQKLQKLMKNLRYILQSNLFNKYNRQFDPASRSENESVTKGVPDYFL